LLVGSFFAGQVAEPIAIIVAYGPHAFFVEGLRITDGKHDALSNGAYLSFLGKLIEVLTTLVLMVLPVYGADFGTMLIRPLVGRGAPWAGAFLRLLGSAGLLLFVRWLYRRGYPLIHPIPFAALIAGVVLIWRAIGSALRGNPPQPQT
jgi:hypothetical protein